MWDLIVSVPDHCLSFYFVNFGQPTCPLVAQMFYTILYTSVFVLGYQNCLKFHEQP